MEALALKQSLTLLLYFERKFGTLRILFKQEVSERPRRTVEQKKNYMILAFRGWFCIQFYYKGIEWLIVVTEVRL